MRNFIVMMLILLTAFALYCIGLLVATKANAAISIDTTCVGGNSYLSCSTTIGSTQQPIIQWRTITPEQRGRWLMRCRPTLWIDRYGVERYQYARPGCEYGP